MQFTAILTNLAFLATTVSAATTFTTTNGFPLPENSDGCNKNVFCGSNSLQTAPFTVGREGCGYILSVRTEGNIVAGHPINCLGDGLLSATGSSSLLKRPLFSQVLGCFQEEDDFNNSWEPSRGNLC
ncbi:hypothetical protein HYFRA_00012335 [Hymenoscyphus fraxineus]|uniref:Uncharacterized protein n=1 Tax=Hymenoscyphus fraxineus TaxID=746836 RepID=A0A9N9L365_9HELO|nr:hypothetical protein HYFRA_00012335 [Hymenoscyphus fraxineus]